MKFIINKYMLGVIIIFILFEFAICADYHQYVDSNIKNTVKNIELRFDEVKASADELVYRVIVISGVWRDIAM